MTDEVIGSLNWDASAAEETTAEVERKAELALEKVKEVKSEQQESFEEVADMMRASYMMVSGLSQVLGGNLPQIFSSMFSVAISSIMTYKAIAAAMAASGVGTAQAVLMFSSLIVAMTNMYTAMRGETELARRVSGLNTMIHGISATIGSLNFL